MALPRQEVETLVAANEKSDVAEHPKMFQDIVLPGGAKATRLFFHAIE
jgi:hypothetical protein